MVYPRVVGEGIGKGNGETITANAIRSKPTNIIKTNQYPAFVACRTAEICMHPHA